MYKVYNGTAQEEFLLQVVKDKAEFDKVFKSGFYQNHTLIILNDKGEYCDMELNVVPHPTTSMDSMVGLLQNKFQTKNGNKK